MVSRWAAMSARDTTSGPQSPLVESIRPSVSKNRARLCCGTPFVKVITNCNSSSLIGFSVSLLAPANALTCDYVNAVARERCGGMRTWITKHTSWPRPHRLPRHPPRQIGMLGIGGATVASIERSFATKDMFALCWWS